MKKNNMNFLTEGEALVGGILLGFMQVWAKFASQIVCSSKRRN